MKVPVYLALDFPAAAVFTHLGAGRERQWVVEIIKVWGRGTIARLV